MLRRTAISVTPLEDCRLLLEFDNCEASAFDVQPHIKGGWFI